MKTELTLVSLILAAVLSFESAAIEPHKHSGWHDKMKSERIAYLSSEMDLTPDEAAEFWAMYNEAEGARMKSFDKIMETFKDLDKAVKDKVSEKELEKCLKAYLDALDASRKIDIEYIDRYKKIIPAEKVAKLLLGEEKFRRQQISKLRGGHRKDSGEKKKN